MLLWHDKYDKYMLFYREQDSGIKEERVLGQSFSNTIYANWGYMRDQLLNWLIGWIDWLIWLNELLVDGGD